MRRSILFCIMLVMAVPAAPAVAKSQKEKAAQQFETFWNERLQGYVSQVGPLNDKHKATITAFTAKPFKFEEGDDRLLKMIRAADDAAFVSGKGQELEAFLVQFKSRPSIGIMQAYLQQRISVVTGLAGHVEAKRQEMLSVAQKPQARLFDLLVAVEAAAVARGDAIGRSEELKLIIENAGAYAADHSAAVERDAMNRARWSAALSAFGQSLNRQRYSVNCMRMGNMVNCTGQ